jgi:hypothetical protein
VSERSEHRILVVEIVLDETEDESTAKATLDLGGQHLGGWGRARRNPNDPDVPRIGEQLATARALSDLAHGLLDRAAEGIERYEGRSVEVHE